MADLNQLLGKIAEVRDAIKNSADGLQDRRAVYETRKSFLEKSGRIGQLMRYMKEIEPAQKADFGKKVNELKSWQSITSIRSMRRRSRRSFSPATRARRSTSRCLPRTDRSGASIR